ncbi:MAG: hypothetical protein NC079_07225 [Clostridium sp.]|nr:hypothetical protein [Clostridium sp.]
MLLAGAVIFLLEYTGIMAQGVDYMLCHIVLTVLGIGITGFLLRREVLRGELDYDNAEHPGRFWLCFLLGLAVAFVSAFLPVAAWPFLPVYVLLGLFGSLNLGVLAGTVLLAVPVCLSGAGAESFLIYLISGLFGVSLFQKLRSDFRAGMPLTLSLGCLLVCETAGTVLVLNARPEIEYFFVPLVNLIVSGILIFVVLKWFSEKIVYQYRENYLDLNDQENEMLSAFRQKDRDAYMKCVHTAYFCERIAGKLGMNAEALKCAGYYQGMEELDELLDRQIFPPAAHGILTEYRDRGKPVRSREAAVLLVSENVIDAILGAIRASAGSDVDYGKVIDELFMSYRKAGTFTQCDISVRELYAMYKIFKEEKLYYDFLR